MVLLIAKRKFVWLIVLRAHRKQKGPLFNGELMVHDSWFLDEPSDKVDYMIMTNTTMIDRLKQFVESKMRSCSMNIGGITPLYVYRMWGGSVAIDEIENAMAEIGRMM